MVRATKPMEQHMIRASDRDLMRQVFDLARHYPFAHNVLGRTEAEAYVRRLSKMGNWHSMLCDSQVLACAHLSLYGQGDGETHSLWKIRHPMLAPNPIAIDALTQLLIELGREARRLRPGSIKLVSFLGQEETQIAEVMVKAGFTLEGQLADYYRLGEVCMVFGRTLRSNEP